MANNNPSLRQDGHMYYVVGQEDGGGHITFVETITERDCCKATGFVLVRDAARGDPTVHRGWAIYIKDGVRWIKVCEEENVENEYGLSTELLNMFATTGALRTLRDENALDHERYEQNIADVEALQESKHSHTNKENLDLLGDAYGQLTYRGKAIGQGPYVYEKFNTEGKLVWVDPTVSEIVDPVSVDSSAQIANYFANTAAAYNGLTLLVVEEDKAVSSYVIVKVGNDLKAKHVGRFGGDNNDHQLGLQFVSALPDPSAIYEGEYFFLCAPGYSGQKINRTYICSHNTDTDAWFWEDIQDKFSINVQGPVITTCYRDRWNKINITWDDPDDVTDSATSRKISWNRTYLVRKFGGVPQDKSDGVIVTCSYTHNKFKETPFVDVCPISGDEVFYGVFSVSNSENDYASFGNVSEAVFPDWDYIRQLIDNGHASKFFKLGDMFALPEHSVFGPIACTVTAIDGNEVYLTARTALKNHQLCYDAVEHGMVPVTGNGMMGKTAVGTITVDSTTKYYHFNSGKYEVIPSTDYSYGDPYTDGKLNGSQLFVGPVNNAAYDGINFVRHGNHTWETSNLYRWLNSYAENWFSPIGNYDMNGINLPGFLFGFEKKMDGTGNDYGFIDLVKRVELPSDASGLFRTVENKNGKRFWMAGGPQQFMANCANIGDDGSMIESTDYPEREHYVVPVIVIGPTTTPAE